MLALNSKLTKWTRTIKTEERRQCVPWRHPQAQDKLSSLLWKFEVQDQGDSNDKNCNNGGNNLLVLAHPPWHSSQNFFALSYVIIHPMQSRRKAIRLQWHVVLPVLLQGKIYNPSTDKENRWSYLLQLKLES